MKKAAALISLATLATGVSAQGISSHGVTLEQKDLPVLTVGGLQFKDMNRNGRLDRYEDWRLPAEDRARNLVTWMTLEEKAGAMMHGTFPTVADAGGLGGGAVYDQEAIAKTIETKKVNTYITRLDTNPENFAKQNNALQVLAEQSRLAIPLSISTDPRNSFLYTPGASNQSGSFSKWPEALGLGAIGDAKVVKTFAEVVRDEYRAVGINVALSPQADLYTEPRWPRGSGTFGQDAQLAKRLVRAYVQGMQNGNFLNPGSVVTVVKHWVGYGEAKDGWDSHNAYGKYADFYGKDIRQHIVPFIGAFEANVGSVMPTYSILQNASHQGRPIEEQVGAGFNRFLLQDLLRDRYGFKGVVVSDWLITKDCNEACQNGSKPGEPFSLGMPWGVESLTELERTAKAINAGVDQLGGVDDSSLVVSAVKQGLVSERRVDEAVIRIMKQKFEQGLFENPYVDETKAAEVVGSAEHQRLADDAQKNSLVLLKNRKLLPIGQGRNVYLYNVDATAAQKAGLNVVDSLDKADVAIMRSTAPYELLHPNYLFGSMQHEGSLDYPEDNPDLLQIKAASAKGVPTVVSVYLDRPAVLTKLQGQVGALIGNFGVSDEILLDAVVNPTRFKGKLPFDLPLSMEQVINRHSTNQEGNRKPLYPMGYGLMF
ncbi:glycoside hydrolase family 3 protein [Pseudomonas luteola]|uniref:glycoside hydrolase family 3 protein n=1 Tax=Pseudomonas luteola TaxID=47886 RepID=UPI000F77BAC4|nr:glycoside hydrolase family 3 N-terminal domain-containing protein [Pseudomonas luteola]RRW42723.1 glycoside hydrolase family 3 protein [Pseudomonas luteola]